MEKIKVGSVSYLNARPLLYGLQRSEELMLQMELIEEFPSKIGGMLIDGSIDVGLVPVAVIPKMKEWHIITDFCIGATGDVASVCLFSEVPIEQIDTVLLDYQSRTSVNLCKVLLKHHWKIQPRIVETTGEDYRSQITGTTAGVVIGDRALEQRLVSSYIYDLATEWRIMTGLPFMFAAWIANKPLPPAFVDAFNQANSIGFEHLQEIIAANPFKAYDLHTYYTENISYDLTEEKRKGLLLFVEYLQKMEVLKPVM
ncbi:menaquinone biosynthetic enzyme MqnA/MqnD family protein [Filimonas lacunae]|uniref:menaquinone biosynthetic enzyme MqnA/MqnD family protein n=1 Tax=Filimonas lacunae TaxID=477680 RepID=UPI0007D72B45|nr:menaquinone biosynthesis protein [Filimonas lacunae]BAV07196.1 menaquinone via futalosine step 1 [Filimonas lacunae]